MVYNSYYANIITRLIFLIASFIGLAYLLVNTSRFFTLVFLAVLTIIQIISLLYFLNKTNRNLARFLLLLTEEDTSVIAWKDRVEKSFQGLHHSFKKANEEIIRNRLEKEKGTILLQNTVDHIPTGIFVLNEDGMIELVNDEALKIFDIITFERLEDLDLFQAGLSDKFSKLRYDSGNIIHLRIDGDNQIPVMVRVSAFKLGEKTLSSSQFRVLKMNWKPMRLNHGRSLPECLLMKYPIQSRQFQPLGLGFTES